MPDRSTNVECPDCDQMVLEKNMHRHYRRRHPGLDPARRMKEGKERRAIRRSPFDTDTSTWVPIVSVLAVTALLVIAGLIIYGMTRDDDKVPDSSPIRYTSSDGAIINGTFYYAGKSGAYTIYLFHDLGQDRHVWDGTARFFQSEGYNVVTVDLRGHGTSTNNVKDPTIRYDHRTMTDGDFAKIKEDVIGAQKWVTVGTDERTGKKNTDAGSEGAIVAVGTLGAVVFNQAARMAAQWGIDSGIYVDPVRDAYGIETYQASEDWGDVRPMMLLSGDGDSEVLRAVKVIADNRPENSITVTIPTSDRGVELFAHDDARYSALETFSNGFEIANS